MAKVCPPGFYCIEVGNLILIFVAAAMVLVGYLTGFNLSQNKNYREPVRRRNRRKSIMEDNYYDEKNEDNYDYDENHDEMIERENQLRQKIMILKF